MTQVSIDLPQGWLPLPPAGDSGNPLYAAAPADWPADYGIRPNLVVTLGEPGEGSVAAVATRAAATFVALDPSCHIVSWDLWRDDSGRRLVVTYPADGALVCSTTWLRAEGDRVVSITATVDADRYLRVQPVLDLAAESLQLSDVPAGERVVVPNKEPRLDEFWLARGEQLEDLGRIQVAQPWTPGDGIDLSRDAFAALAETDRRGLSRGHRVAVVVAPELAAVGLADSGGRLTDDGEAVWRVLSGADRRIRVEASAGGVPATLEVARLGSTAVLWATESPAGPGASHQSARGRDALAAATTGRLLWLPAMQVAADLARWLQVGPAWPFDLGSHSLPGAQLLDRMDDPSAPVPEGADEMLAAIWREPWFAWTVAADTGHALAGVHAGRHGHLRLNFPHDGQALRPVGGEPVNLRCLLPQILFATLTELSVR